MNVEKIDWDNAPEDAQYCQEGRWYKIENNHVFTRHLTDGDAEWVKSAWTVEDDLDNHPGFIKRPVSTSAETHLIEIKPPLGLTPKNIWEEQMQHQRRKDIHAAMTRYIEAGKEIPNDWLGELIGVNNVLAKIETDFAEAIQSLPVAEEEGWVENTQTSDSFPSCLGGDTKIKVELRNGSMLTGNASDWSYSWNTSNNTHSDIVRYCIIEE